MCNIKPPQHPERHLARRYDCVTRSKEFQQTVHGGYVETDAPVDTVTVVKNGKDCIKLKSRPERAILDYQQEQEADYYNPCVRLTDSRFTRRSPIWGSGKV